MPAPVRAARVLMYLVAGLTAVLSAASLLALGVTVGTLGDVAVFALPGVASFALALLIPRGEPRLWRMIIALEAVYVVLSLARLGDGDPRGLVNLVLPVAILVLITRAPARSYFRVHFVRTARRS
jgi:hypothetical protein